MNVKSALIIEVEKDGHLFSYVVPAGCQYGQAYDACFEVLKKLLEMSQHHVESLKKAQEHTDGPE